MEFGISGTVSPDTAARSGTSWAPKHSSPDGCFGPGDQLVAVARMIGTETGRVYAESATSGRRAGRQTCRDDSRKSVEPVDACSERWWPPPRRRTDRLQRLVVLVCGKTLPTVSISIPERHAGRAGLDPAAETELALVFNSLGFRLLDPESSVRADIQITGEAQSDVSRRGRLFPRAGASRSKPSTARHMQLSSRIARPRLPSTCPARWLERKPCNGPRRCCRSA